MNHLRAYFGEEYSDAENQDKQGSRETVQKEKIRKNIQAESLPQSYFDQEDSQEKAQPAEIHPRLTRRHVPHQEDGSILNMIEHGFAHGK